MATQYQLDTLRKAEDLYRGLATGEFKLYRQKDYKFLEPDAAVAQDRALAMKNLREELEIQ
jgi:hypothetical protein